MAHEIENMLSVGQMPWHRLGTVVETAPTIAEAIKMAGLDWAVRKESIYLAGDEAFTLGKEIPDTFALVRSSDNSILSTVGPRYQPLQNAQAFDFFQPFVDSGMATIETAGSLRNGERIWVMAKITENGNEIKITGDDTIRKFVLLSNSHDGLSAIRVGLTPVRVVCANTLAAAHNSDQSKLLRVRHGANNTANLEAIRDTINLVNKQFEATAEQYRFLANTEIDAEDLRKFVKVVLKIATADTDLTDRQQAEIGNIVGLFDSGRGAQTTAATYWRAYNAYTEYLSHENGRTAETRYNNLWYGTAKNESANALEVATQMAKAA